MRLAFQVLLFLLLVGPVMAARPTLETQGTTGLTFNDNITLSRADVNFGPGVLASQDLLGVVRVRTSMRLKNSELVYNGSRTRFFKNPQLGFVENGLELTHEQVVRRLFVMQGQLQFSRVDPDQIVRADARGAFPFTTSEPPDRQVISLILQTPPERAVELGVRLLAQDSQYSNNPLLDADARALQVRASRQLSDQWNIGVERQFVRREYPNLVATPGSPIEAKASHVAGQLGYAPNKHFSYLIKSLWLDQYANVDAFFLEQRDVSLGASWEDEGWGGASLLMQSSRRDFRRRPLPMGGNQLDRDLLLVFALTKRLGNRSAVTFGYTYDRNKSNIVDFDYSNRIERLEFTRSF